MLSDSDNQEASGRWRALTRARLRPETNTWLTELTGELREVLVAASWEIKSEDALRSFGARLEAIFKAILDVRVAIGEKVTSADIEVYVVPPGSPFDNAHMEDEYPDHRQEGWPVVIATTAVGLWKVVQPSAPNGSLAYTHILPPKIVLESTMMALLQPHTRDQNVSTLGRD